MLFEDRTDAGRQLADKLTEYAQREDVMILALPRGGVPVAFEIARVLQLPLDLFLVRKLGVPGDAELAFGAVASGGQRVINRSVVEFEQLTEAEIEAVTESEQRELERRERAYRDNRPSPQLKDKTVILVDDGLATGATMLAAVLALREHQPAKIVVAVPTASPETCAEFENYVDEIVCASTPDPFYSVGSWYRDFAQTTDDEVRELLARIWDRQTTVNEK